jgi:ADP-ribosylglycohydrolase
MRIPTKEQFRGCLLGQCVGDALGMPVERHSPDVCFKYVQQLKAGRIGERSHSNFVFGQYTDDSQLARELIQSYVACRKFCPNDYAVRIAAIYAEERIVGSSSATAKVALRLAQGISWLEAGTPPPYARNGSAMRAAPIGLFFYHHPEKLIQAAYDQGRITHQDKSSLAGAVAIALSVALAIQSNDVEHSSFLNQLSTWVRQIEASVADSLQDLIDWVCLPPQAAVKKIALSGNPPNSLSDWEGISPHVHPSVLWSLYAFLRTPGDYWETICTAISVGGDVDTTAAMAGAISGAYLGEKAVPTQVAVQLTDRGTWGYSELISLADRCYQLSMELGLLT